MIIRTMSVAVQRSADHYPHFFTQPPAMTQDEQDSGCYWGFGGVSEDGDNVHHAYVLCRPDAAQSSPTDADIDRRVQLLREAAVFHELPFTTPRDYCTVDGRFYRHHRADSAGTEWSETDEATFAAGLRATAIRELLRERGGK